MPQTAQDANVMASTAQGLSLIHISEPTRLGMISYAVFCLKKKKEAELKANLDAIDINLAETTIIAPPHWGKAVVEVLLVRPGDLVQPNQPVIRCLRVED